MAMKALSPMRGRLMVLVLALLSVAVLMAILSKCSQDAHSPFDHTYVKSGDDTLDIAIEYNPTIYSVRGDSIFGRDYGILRKISEKHNVAMKFHPFVPLSHALNGLENGDYDLVVASMPMTSKMREKFLMTNPIYLDREVLVQLTDTTLGHGQIVSQIQLGGDTVWVPKDSPIATRIANLSQEIGDTIYVESDVNYTAEHLLMLVACGEIRLAVVNESVAAEMLSRYPQLDISTPISFTQFQSWAINKNDSVLLDSINLWLMDIDMVKD